MNYHILNVIICSYEHFYVLYCRFFELDLDKDSKLSRDDLLRYNDHALSEMIVDRWKKASTMCLYRLILLHRIFEVGMRVFSDGIEGEFKGSGGMGFVDFIYFMLSEEDKTTDTSLAYWYLLHCLKFSCVSDLTS